MLLPSVSLLSSRWFANQSRVEIAGVWPLIGRSLSFKEVFTSARADQRWGIVRERGNGRSIRGRSELISQRQKLHAVRHSLSQPRSFVFEAEQIRWILKLVRTT